MVIHEGRLQGRGGLPHRRGERGRWDIIPRTGRHDAESKTAGRLTQKMGMIDR